MWTYLFDSIELFSNHKSFSLGVDTTRNLWLLLHFKDLEIKSKTLIYQVNNGYRQRKNTVHPQRKMQKKHKNTAELLDYLNTKSYDIRQLEIEFTNGWKIKQKPFIQLCFYLNSTSERDDLIHKLLTAAGQGPINVSNLEPNFSYSFIGNSELVKIDIDGLPFPDEFWPDDLKYIHLSGNRNKSGRNRIVPVPSYIRDILVKGEPHHNIFSGKPQPLNQDYFKTLWGRFKRVSKLLEQDQTLYSFRHSGAIEIFKRTGSITKLQKAMGHSSINVSLTYLRCLEIAELKEEDMPNIKTPAKSKGLY